MERCRHKFDLIRRCLAFNRGTVVSFSLMHFIRACKRRTRSIWRFFARCQTCRNTLNENQVRTKGERETVTENKIKYIFRIYMCVDIQNTKDKHTSLVVHTLYLAHTQRFTYTNTKRREEQSREPPMKIRNLLCTVHTKIDSGVEEDRKRETQAPVCIHGGIGMVWSWIK